MPNSFSSTSFIFFFFNDTATTEIYTLSLHDALPISSERQYRSTGLQRDRARIPCQTPGAPLDRKSTRLNSSHSSISYAVFCLKKKKKYFNLFAMCVMHLTMTKQHNPETCNVAMTLLQ